MTEVRHNLTALFLNQFIFAAVETLPERISQANCIFKTSSIKYYFIITASHTFRGTCCYKQNLVTYGNIWQTSLQSGELCGTVVFCLVYVLQCFASKSLRYKSDPETKVVLTTFEPITGFCLFVCLLLFGCFF